MKKRSFNIYLLIILIISLAVYLSLAYIKFTIRTNEEDIVFIDEFLLNGNQDDLHERKIKIDDVGIYEYSATIEGEALKRINGDALLVVTRIRGAWHKIYFNDVLVGVIGDEQQTSINLWNSVYKFIIPKESIKESNTLKFKTYSDYKIGHGTIPIFVSNSYLGNKLYYMLKALYSNFYLVVIGILLSISIMEIMIIMMTNSYAKKNALVPFSILIVSIYLLDYTVIPYSFLSPLIFKKIVVSALYVSAILISYVLSIKYGSKLIKFFAATLLISLLVVLVVSDNLIVFGYLYNRLNLLLLLCVISWIVLAFKSYFSNQTYQDFMIGISGILLLGPGIYDTISLLILGGNLMRVGVYGIVNYSMAMLLISMVNYIDYQKNVFSEENVLEIERKHLSKALVTDELTGLYNHRHFYDIFNKKILNNDEVINIILIDIDKFRPINELKGHSVGDEILKKIANNIVDIVSVYDAVFRYGGEEFIIMCYEYLCKSPEELAESIRRRILEDEKLQELSGYLPLTLSIGISRYPTDSSNLKSIVSKAEKAVLFAKLNGRNRVCVYDKSIESLVEGDYETNLKNQMLLDFVYTLAASIDMKDAYTGFHSEEVSRFGMLIAEELQLTSEQKYSLKVGGLLHDFGKLSIPDTIIKKVEKLTYEEYKLIKDHPRAGYEIVKQIVDDSDVIACVRSHHERFDGKGYPDGLKGNRIPFLGRIICVADAYHAMISNRSYRKSLTQEEAILELMKNRDLQFDSKIVDAFIRVLRKQRNI